MAPNGHIRCTDSIVLILVVSSKNPNLALVFYPYLGGAQDMPRWMKAKIHAVDSENLPPSYALDLDVAESMPQNRDVGMVGQVVSVPKSCMVRMPMSDNRPVYGFPRV
jgi:hypothetical protein